MEDEAVETLEAGNDQLGRTDNGAMIWKNTLTGFFGVWRDPLRLPRQFCYNFDQQARRMNFGSLFRRVFYADET